MINCGTCWSVLICDRSNLVMPGDEGSLPLTFNSWNACNVTKLPRPIPGGDESCHVQSSKRDMTRRPRQLTWVISTASGQSIEQVCLESCKSSAYLQLQFYERNWHIPYQLMAAALLGSACMCHMRLQRIRIRGFWGLSHWIKIKDEFKAKRYNIYIYED